MERETCSVLLRKNNKVWLGWQGQRTEIRVHHLDGSKWLKYPNFMGSK